MENHHARGRYRRHIAAVGFVAAGTLVFSQSTAVADPSADDVRSELQRLEQDLSELNATYTEAEENHEAALKRLEGIQEELEEAENGLSGMRDEVRALASAAYSGGDFSSPSYLLGSAGPEEVLEYADDLGYLSQSQQQRLERYSEERERLESLEQEAERTEEEAADELERAEEAKAEGEAKIEEQEELLAELTAEEQQDATGDTGASYTGSASGDARVALEFAYAQIGKPYVWGGTGPDGYDCSGLTQAAWAEAGVSLPRTSQQQFHAGRRVSWENMRPGDLVFFYGSSPTHMGMYSGNGKMVHASTSSKPIAEVELDSYYRENFSGAVRP